MKISIIIPVYNVSEYIYDCLRSVYNQTYKDLEIIIVDDCGIDDSMKRVDEFISQSLIKREVKIIKHTHNRGLSAARNTGIVNATGEYVFFLDSDDVISENSIELLVGPLFKDSIDFVVGKFIVINEDKKYPNLKVNEGLYIGNELILESYTHGEWYAMAWNKLINKEFLIRNELFFKEGLLHEDILWSFKLACTANSMFAVDAETYSYIIRGNSISQNFGLKNCNALVEVIDDCVNFYTLKSNISNNNVYNYIERQKISLLEIVKKTFDNKITYEFYKKCRLHLIPINRPNIKSLIRDFHYKIPSLWGFYYIMIMMKINELRTR